MTPEIILEMSAAKLAELSDEALEEYFAPYLDNTRPQLNLVRPKAAGRVNLNEVPDRKFKSKPKLSEKEKLLQQIQELNLKYNVAVKPEDLPKDIK